MIALLMASLQNAVLVSQPVTACAPSPTRAPPRAHHAPSAPTFFFFLSPSPCLLGTQLKGIAGDITVKCFFHHKTLCSCWNKRGRTHTHGAVAASFDFRSSNVDEAHMKRSAASRRHRSDRPPPQPTVKSYKISQLYSGMCFVPDPRPPVRHVDTSPFQAANLITGRRSGVTSPVLVR